METVSAASGKGKSQRAAKLVLCLFGAVLIAFFAAIVWFVVMRPQAAGWTFIILMILGAVPTVMAWLKGKR